MDSDKARDLLSNLLGRNISARAGAWLSAFVLIVTIVALVTTALGFLKPVAQPSPPVVVQILPPTATAPALIAPISSVEDQAEGPMRAPKPRPARRQASDSETLGPPDAKTVKAGGENSTGPVSNVSGIVTNGQVGSNSQSAAPRT